MTSVNNFPTYTAAKKIVLDAGIDTVIKYRAWLSECGFAMPYHPQRHYKSEWFNWNVFFGKYKGAMASYKEAQQIVRIAKIKSSSEYYKWYKKSPERIPSYPPRKYIKNWNGWSSFLGAYQKFATYEEAKHIIQGMGITTCVGYKAWYANSEIKLPASPQIMYKEWTNWYDFFGKVPNG